MPQLMRKKKEDVDLNKGYGVMGRAFGSGSAPAANVQPVTTYAPGQAPPVPTPTPVANTPPYNIYDPNGPEVAAGQKLVDTVFPSPQEGWTRKRAARAERQAQPATPPAAAFRDTSPTVSIYNQGSPATRSFGETRAANQAVVDQQPPLQEQIAEATPAPDKKKKKKRSLNPLDMVPIDMFGSPEDAISRDQKVQDLTSGVAGTISNIAKSTPAAGLVRGVQEGFNSVDINNAQDAGEATRKAVVGGAKGIADSVMNSAPVAFMRDQVAPFVSGLTGLGGSGEAAAMLPPDQQPAVPTTPSETPGQEMQRVAGPQPAAAVPEQGQAFNRPETPVDSQAAPTGNWIRNESTGETFSIGPNNEIQKFQGQPSQQGMAVTQQQGAPANDNARSFSTGNLDVQFDDTVSPSQRKDFLAGPEVSAKDGHYATHLGASNFGGGRDSRAGSSGGGDLNTGKIRTFGDVMRTKAAMKNRKETAAIRNADDRTALTARGQDIDLAQSRMAADTAAGKQAIDAADTKSQIEQRRLAGEATILDTEQKRRLADLQNEYVAETDPRKRKELKRQLLTLAGKNETKQQVVVRDDINDLGQKTGQTFFTRDPNDETRLIPMATGQDPAQADTSGALPFPGAGGNLVKGQVYISKDGKFRGVWDGSQLTGVQPIQ